MVLEDCREVKGGPEAQKICLECSVKERCRKCGRHLRACRMNPHSSTCWTCYRKMIGRDEQGGAGVRIRGRKDTMGDLFSKTSLQAGIEDVDPFVFATDRKEDITDSLEASLVQNG